MDFVSTYTPGSAELNRNVVQGIQPIDRVNEFVVNTFVDPLEFNNLSDSVSVMEAACTDAFQLSVVRSDRFKGNLGSTIPGDVKPDYAKWATALPGMIAVTRKSKDMNFRGYTAAETAAPVIVCAQGLVKALDDAFFFAGIVRSQSIQSPDDGSGPPIDSHFTLHVGGICTVLNNGPEALNAGDGVAWTFHNFAQGTQQGVLRSNGMAKSEPRRIQIVRIPPGVDHPRQFGTVKSYARPGEGCDIIVGPTLA